MSWPSRITRAFAAAQEEANLVARENQYYGPYNKLLYTLFPADSDFIISPDHLPGNADGGASFVVSFENAHRLYPVFILEVKPPNHLSLISTREAADRQIRRRLADLAEYAPVPTIFGVSAMGTKFRFYQLQTVPQRHMTPQLIPSDPELIADVTPKELWDCDIFQAPGKLHLLELTRQIREACERLLVQD